MSEEVSAVESTPVSPTPEQLAAFNKQLAERADMDQREEGFMQALEALMAQYRVTVLPTITIVGSQIQSSISVSANK